MNAINHSFVARSAVSALGVNGPKALFASIHIVQWPEDKLPPSRAKQAKPVTPVCQPDRAESSVGDLMAKVAVHSLGTERVELP